MNCAPFVYICCSACVNKQPAPQIPFQPRPTSHTSSLKTIACMVKNKRSPHHPQTNLSAMSTNPNNANWAHNAQAAYQAQLAHVAHEAAVHEAQAIHEAQQLEAQAAYEAQMYEAQVYYEAQQPMIIHTTAHWFWQCHIVRPISPSPSPHLPPSNPTSLPQKEGVHAREPATSLPPFFVLLNCLPQTSRSAKTRLC